MNPLPLVAAAWAIAFQSTPPDLTIVEDVRGIREFRITIDPKSPLFRFQYIGDADNYPQEVRCYQLGASTPFQTLPIYEDAAESFGDLEPPYRGSDFFTGVDFNRDGYSDLRLLAMWGATGNHLYLYYLWDPLRREFVHDRQFDLCSSELDEHLCCYQHRNDGAAGCNYSDSTHCLVDGRLTLKSAVSQQPSQARRCLERTTITVTNGQSTAHIFTTCDSTIISDPQKCHEW